MTTLYLKKMPPGARRWRCLLLGGGGIYKECHPGPAAVGCPLGIGEREGHCALLLKMGLEGLCATRHEALHTKPRGWAGGPGGAHTAAEPSPCIQGSPSPSHG